MGENLRICRWPFDMDNVSVHQDGKLCRRPDTNATAAGRNSSDKAGSRKPSQHSVFQMQHPNVHSSKYEIVSALKERGMCLPRARSSERNRLPAAARGRSTYFCLGKVCSGGNSRGKLIAWSGE